MVFGLICSCYSADFLLHWADLFVLPGRFLRLDRLIRIHGPINSYSWADLLYYGVLFMLLDRFIMLLGRFVAAFSRFIHVTGPFIHATGLYFWRYWADFYDTGLI